MILIADLLAPGRGSCYTGLAIATNNLFREDLRK